MTPKEIFNKMYEKDAFSQWLGMECTSISPGACTLEMVIRAEMVNGFGMAHGAITYALADSAFAFASNSQGRHAVSVETSISHIKSTFPGDKLIATAKEISIGHKLGRYQISVTNGEGVEVALFYGTVYRKSAEWSL